MATIFYYTVIPVNDTTRDMIVESLKDREGTQPGSDDIQRAELGTKIIKDTITNTEYTVIKFASKFPNSTVGHRVYTISEISDLLTKSWWKHTQEEE